MPTNRNLIPEKYPIFKSKLPTIGKHITALQTTDEIVVYQAYKPAIADYAIAHQTFGGKAFSYNRMSWIKPNFLWMMYRCGWATKENQERVLAIWLKKSDWESILAKAVYSSFQKHIYGTIEQWRAALQQSEVRLQWDPAHDPYGAKLERKAIQIGMKGETLSAFGREMIQQIHDVTDFVKTQKKNLDEAGLTALEVPQETLYTLQDLDINIF